MNDAAESLMGGAEEAPSEGNGIPVTPEQESTLSGYSDSYKELVQSRGWKSPDDVLKSYSELEKHTGASADRLLTLDPDGKLSPASREKLGIPEAKDGYDFGEGFAEDQEWYRDAAHELGLSASQAKALFEKYQANDPILQAQTEYKQQHESWMESMTLEQTNNITQLARKGADAIGLLNNEEMLNNLQFAMGGKAMMEMFAKLGERVGKETFATGESSQAFSRQGARMQIDQLKSDPAFRQRLLSGDKAARQQWDDLFKRMA